MRPLAHHGGEPWSSSSFPESAGNAMARLSRYVVSHLDSRGAARFPCRGRPLETALLLRLLESTGQSSTQQVHYLRPLPPDSDPFALAIARAALRQGGTPSGELRASVVAKS